METLEHNLMLTTSERGPGGRLLAVGDARPIYRRIGRLMEEKIEPKLGWCDKQFAREKSKLYSTPYHVRSEKTLPHPDGPFFEVYGEETGREDGCFSERTT